MSALVLALITSAFAAPAGYKLETEKYGCAFYLSPKAASGYSTILAECVWSDVSPEQLDKTLAYLPGHAKVHSSVQSAVVVGNEGGGTRVQQVHVASGISDRQADLIYKRAEVGGVITWSWDMAPNQPAPEDGRVTPAADKGAWVISANPAGGSNVTYELLYEPGGSVPGFVVRAFQSSGIVELVGEMRPVAAARKL